MRNRAVGSTSATEYTALVSAPSSTGVEVAGGLHKTRTSVEIVRGAASLFACVLAFAACARRDVMFTYSDGSPSRHYQMKGRARDGLATFRTPEGQVVELCTWRRGLREGEWTTWYPSGAERERGAFVDGLREGVWRVRHDNGTLASEGRYERGERVGRWRAWKPDGTLLLDEEWDAGELRARLLDFR